MTRNFTQGVGREDKSRNRGLQNLLVLGEKEEVARSAEEEQERRITLGCQRVRREC